MTAAPHRAAGDDAAPGCAVEGCDRRVTRRSGSGAWRKHCEGHIRAVTREGEAALERPLGKGSGVRYATPFDRLFNAAVELARADSEDDDAWRKRVERFRSAYRAALTRELARLRIEETVALLGPHEGSPVAVHPGPETAPNAGRLILTGKGSGPAERQAEEGAPSDRAEAPGRRTPRRR